MGVEFLKPTRDLIELIADDIRQADADEVWASNHHTPMESLSLGLKESDNSVIVSVDGDPCVMIGLVKRGILSGVGVPWMLGTNKSLKHSRQFIEEVPAIISEMLELCPELFNYVHAKNKISIRWLKRIGFTIDNPTPYGYENELFHKFHLTRV